MTDPAVVSPRGKQARSEMSTRRLLQAAVELIAERGYERTTLIAIGEKAGYSRALVTGRFGSKDNLLWHLLERHFIQWSEERLDPELDALPAPQALERVLERTRENVHTVPTHMRALYSILFESLVLVPAIRERVADMHRQHRATIERILRRGLDEGSVTGDIDVVALAGVWVGAFRGIAFQWLLDPDDFDLDAALASMARVVSGVLTAPAVPAAPPGQPARRGGR